MSSVSTGAPEGWVPVERRWLGFDRRTILPALVVAALAVLTLIIIPAINNAVPNDDRVRSGEVLQAGDVQFTPVAGWGVVTGLRAGHPAAGGSYPNTAEVQSGSVAFVVSVDSYTGSAPALLARIRSTNNKLTFKGSLHVDSATRSATTSTGIPGVLARYGGTRADGVIAAFVTGKVGIEVVAFAGDGEFDQQALRSVAGMIASIRVANGASR